MLAPRPPTVALSVSILLVTIPPSTERLLFMVTGPFAVMGPLKVLLERAARGADWLHAAAARRPTGSSTAAR
jgi:hypothetical protein